MIVTLNIPNNITAVKYGFAIMQPYNNTLDVPAYAAKTLLTLPGVTGPALPETAIQLLGETDADAAFEANSIFYAYNQPLPPIDDRIADAVTLMTDRGEPAVSMS